MREVKEMIQILLAMDTDTYAQCKYTMQAASRDRERVKAFTDKLFSLTDRRRPPLIGMQEGGA